MFLIWWQYHHFPPLSLSRGSQCIAVALMLWFCPINTLTTAAIWYCLVLDLGYHLLHLLGIQWSLDYFIFLSSISHVKLLLCWWWQHRSFNDYLVLFVVCAFNCHLGCLIGVSAWARSCLTIFSCKKCLHGSQFLDLLILFALLLMHDMSRCYLIMLGQWVVLSLWSYHFNVWSLIVWWLDMHALLCLNLRYWGIQILLMYPLTFHMAFWILVTLLFRLVWSITRFFRPLRGLWHGVMRSLRQSPLPNWNWICGRLLLAGVLFQNPCPTQSFKHP